MLQKKHYFKIKVVPFLSPVGVYFCHLFLEHITESKTFQVVFNLTNNLDLFRPGMYVDVIVNYAEYKNIPTLPLEVLKVDGSCYTYNEENQTVQYRSFSTQIRDDKFFMIPSELQNESFVINGQGFVFDGQKVTVVNSEKNLLPENNSEEIK
jgi:hypothetical protein